MQRIWVCGSVAYDHIMVFADYFKNHILPDKTHVINVSFFAPEMRKEFGGCAGNIAYNLHLLGLQPDIVATVGEDFAPYAAHLDRLGIAQTSLLQLKDAYTAQCFVTTDLADNQIAAFHPGAMQRSVENLTLTQASPLPRLAIVSPDSREAMRAHCSNLQQRQVEYLFDPGQALPILDADDLKHCIAGAKLSIVNDYECALLQNKLQLDLKALIDLCKTLIVTRGGEGSDIYQGAQHWSIPAIPAERISDPTGCGDAYRAGILFGLVHQLDWPSTGAISALLATYKIESLGTQNHHFSLDEFAERLHQTHPDLARWFLAQNQ